MNDHEHNPPVSLDETINRRQDWTPAARDNGAAALLLTATLATLEAAAELGAVRAAFALGPFDSTITNDVQDDDRSAAA